MWAHERRSWLHDRNESVHGSKEAHGGWRESNVDMGHRHWPARGLCTAGKHGGGRRQPPRGALRPQAGPMLLPSLLHT